MQTKKLLGSTLALAMTLSYSQANAEFLKNFKVSGQLDLQGTAGRNVSDFQTYGQNSKGTNVVNANDRVGDMQTRLMLSMDWDLLDDVHSKVTLRKNDRTWGTNGGVAFPAATKSQPVMPTGGTDVAGNIFVDQAYVKIDKLGGKVDATLGRQFYGNSGDVVIFYGPSDKAEYGMPVTALDAARFDWANDMVGVTGLVGKQVGHTIGVAGASDVDVRGVNAMLKGHDNIAASAYVYNALTHATGDLGAGQTTGGGLNSGGANTNLFVVGVKGKVNLGSAWVGAELDHNMGTDRSQAVTQDASNYVGWAGKIDAGVKAEVSGIGSLMPWLQLAYGTGQSKVDGRSNNAFTPINSDYRPGTIYGRFARGSGLNGADLGLGGGVASFGANGVASNALSNRVIMGVGAKVTPGALNKLTAGASFWDFRTQTSATPIGAGPNDVRPFMGNKHIGSEADLDLTWAHSENVSLGAGVARFWAGGLINEAKQTTGVGASANSGNGVSPVTLEYFDVRVKFGN